MGDRMEASWPQTPPGLPAALATFGALPGLLVRSLASADTAANEFVNLKKYRTAQPVLTFAVATCRLRGGCRQNGCFSGPSWCWPPETTASPPHPRPCWPSRRTGAGLGGGHLSGEILCTGNYFN